MHASAALLLLCASGIAGRPEVAGGVEAATGDPYHGSLGPILEAAYRFRRMFRSLDVESVQVPSCESSPVCWTNLTVDLQGDEVDPTSDIDILRLVRFHEFTQDDVMEQLADNTLPQFELTGYVDYEP